LDNQAGLSDSFPSESLETAPRDSVQDIRDLSKSETDQGAVFLGTSLDLLEGDHNRPGDVVKKHVRIDRNPARKGEKEKRDSRHKSKRAHTAQRI
jgi:hypothetical protein